MRNSIATRLALMFAAAALVGFALLGGALHRVLSNELAHHQQAQIDARLEDMSYMLQHGRAPNLGERIRDKLDTLGTADPRTRSWMWSEDPAFRYGDDLRTGRHCGGCGAGHRATPHGRAAGVQAHPRARNGAPGNGCQASGAIHRGRRCGAVSRHLAHLRDGACDPDPGRHGVVRGARLLDRQNRPRTGGATVGRRRSASAPTTAPSACNCRRSHANWPNSAFRSMPRWIGSMQRTASWRLSATTSRTSCARHWRT